MDVHTAVVTTSLGGFDRVAQYPAQSVKHDYHLFTDDNFPPRYNAMTPRLQAKIPKFFAWQLKPGYDYYLWLDGNLRLKHPDSLKFFLEQCQDHDFVVLKHRDRDTIYWEYRYNRRGVTNNAPSNYLMKRYKGEWLEEQFNEINLYADAPMYQGGVFMYRNTEKTQALLKEWWYHVSRYLIMDQLSWAYLLKTSGLRINALPIDFSNSPWIENARHAK